MPRHYQNFQGRKANAYLQLYCDYGSVAMNKNSGIYGYVCYFDINTIYKKSFKEGKFNIPIN